MIIDYMMKEKKLMVGSGEMAHTGLCTKDLPSGREGETLQELLELCRSRVEWTHHHLS